MCMFFFQRLNYFRENFFERFNPIIIAVRTIVPAISIIKFSALNNTDFGFSVFTVGVLGAFVNDVLLWVLRRINAKVYVIIFDNSE